MGDPQRVGVTSVCATCRFAEWKKTANGRRHPDGSGRCGYAFPVSPLPKWVRVRGWHHASEPLETVGEVVEKHGGNRYIYWREYNRVEPEPCATCEACPK